MATVTGLTAEKIYQELNKTLKNARIDNDSGKLILTMYNGATQMGGDFPAIANVSFNEDAELIITLTDSETINLGVVDSVEDAEINASGNLVLTMKSGSNIDVGLVRPTAPEVLLSETSTSINPENYPGATRFKFEIWGGGGSGGGAFEHSVGAIFPGGGGGGGGYASFEILASELVMASVLVGSSGGSVNTGGGYSGYNTQLDLSISNEEGPSLISVLAGGGGGGGAGANWSGVIYSRAGAGGGGGGSGPGIVRGEPGSMDEPGCGGGLRSTSELIPISENVRPNPQDANDTILDNFKPERYNSHSGGGHGAPGRGANTPVNRAGDSFLGGGGGGSGYYGEEFFVLSKAGDSVYGGGGGGGGLAGVGTISSTETRIGRSQFGGNGGLGGLYWSEQLPPIEFDSIEAEDGQWPGGGGGGAAYEGDWSGSGASGGLKLTVYYS